MDFESRVREILEAAYAPADLNVGIQPGMVRVTGYIVSSAFEGQTPLQRQRRLRAMLSEQLKDDVNRVSTILIYTPSEFEAMNAA